MKTNSIQAPSTLIPEYIGSDFDAVLEVASNIEAVKVAAENIENFKVFPASETTAGIAEIATQAEVNQKTSDSHIVTPKKLGEYAAPLVHTHARATSIESGFLAAADKQKLDGIASNANNYTHPIGDGNLHVPVTGTGNNGKLLKAGATDGSLVWDTISKADVGLSNVDNTSDVNKPISTATANALSDKAPISHIGSVGEEHHGLASQAIAGFMSPTDKIKLDNISGVSVVSGVSSVNGKTGEVVLTKADVGLNLVNNTSDLAKPISTATQTALDAKADTTSITPFARTLIDDVDAAAMRTTLGIDELPVRSFIGDTPPINPWNGVTWYCTDDGRTYVYYADTDSTQWVENSPQNPANTDTLSGTNVNGSYAQFADGTLICWVSTTTSTAATKDITYPMAFNSAPVCTATVEATTPSIVTTQSPSVSGISINGWNMSSARIAVACKIMAVGRWR